jgi:hypothetical protein
VAVVVVAGLGFRTGWVRWKNEGVALEGAAGEPGILGMLDVKRENRRRRRSWLAEIWRGLEVGSMHSKECRRLAAR